MCSPIDDDEKTLVSLAGKLRKNTVSVDFVLFGDLDEATQSKLQAFNDKVKSSEGSHLVAIPPSSKLLSDQLLSTPILLGENAAAASAGGSGGGSGGGGFGGDFDGLDVDPSVDPELALALRMSMEEERARQERRAKEEAEAAQKASLESVKEEDESAQPLLDKEGKPSGEPSKGDDKKDGGDSMDTS